MCIRPITRYVDSVWSTAGKRTILVPCGKCIECLNKKQNEWFTRLYSEALMHSSFIFFTLTYSDKHLPLIVDSQTGEAHGTVYKKHLQDTLKRLRTAYKRKYNKNLDIKYFITSEYGPKTFRPHYHGIFFTSDIGFLLRNFFIDWQKNYGFTKQKVVSQTDSKYFFNACYYCSKYCTKGMFECPLVLSGKVLKPFKLLSKGLSLSYIEKMRYWFVPKFSQKFEWIGKKITYSAKYLSLLLERSFLRLGKYSYFLSRYFKNKLYGEKSKLSYCLSQALLLLSDSIYNKQLESLQASLSFSQSVALLASKDYASHLEKEKLLTEKLYKFYSRSKF